MTLRRRRRRARAFGPRVVGRVGSGSGLVRARVGGARIVVHWSVPLAALGLLLAVPLAVLPVHVHHASASASWPAACVVVLAFVLSRVLREGAHVLTGRWTGLRAERVDVRVLGGRVEFATAPRSARGEAAIVLAGLITDTVLATAVAVTAVLLHTGTWAGALTALGWVLAVVAAVELLPGAPMDGGRLIAASAWARGTRRTETIAAAARAGRWLGIAVALAGSIVTVASPLLGAWIAALGLLMLVGAGTEPWSELAEHLRGRVVADVMDVPPAALPSWWTVRDFIRHFGAVHDLDDVYVLVDGAGRPDGLLTLRALTHVSPRSRAQIRLGACRRRGRVLGVRADTPLDELALSLDHRGGVAAVIEDEHVVGTVTLPALRAEAAMAESAEHDLDTASSGGVRPHHEGADQ